MPAMSASARFRDSSIFRSSSERVMETYTLRRAWSRRRPSGRCEPDSATIPTALPQVALRTSDTLIERLERALHQPHAPLDRRYQQVLLGGVRAVAVDAETVEGRQ